MEKKPRVSIIIVHYRVKEQLFACLASIFTSGIQVPFEVIVVDNDETPVIEKDLVKKFLEVVYKKAPENLGYGAGNNFGATFAKGELLCIVNPDTLFFPRTLDILVAFLQNKKQAAIVAPLLLQKNNEPIPLQGSKTLTPFRAIVCLSFINKYFPNNLIAREYWHMAWDKKEIIETDVVPGTAFLIKKKIFAEIGGFDERMFLFFEEDDLCMRIKKLGYKMFINPNAELVHLWGESTKSLKNTKEIFKKSRQYYFEKHFGKLSAFLVELFCR